MTALSSLYRRSRLGAANAEATGFISSIESDKRLFDAVVRINQAHILMLNRRGIIPRDQARKVIIALSEIDAMPRSKAEDIHVAIEEAVAQRAGKSAGGNLQLAKSRNDQVAAAIRIRLRSDALQIVDSLFFLLAELQKTIRKNSETIFLGRTHLQPAEPTTYGHYLMAFHDAVLRDLERLDALYTRLNLSPMGACALAGTSIHIDRVAVADLLGFDGLLENSLDAVGSRDFALEFLAIMAMLSSDISRLAEDLLFYTTPDVGQLRLPDDLSFTSSIMPQKKNPDIVELIRAKCAVAIAEFSETATILHALPTSYNLDLQQITPCIWNSSKTMEEIVPIIRSLISRTKVEELEASRHDMIMTNATEFANTLVTNLGIPFRLAHQIVASAALEFSKTGSNDGSQWLRIVIEKAQKTTGHRSKRLEAALVQVSSSQAVVRHKRSVGSPSPRETLRLLRKRARSVAHLMRLQRNRKKRLVLAESRLRREVLQLCR